MPSFNTVGKSKQDLAQVAQIAGLLTAAQANRMTRAQLALLLEQASAQTEQSVPAVHRPPAQAVPTQVDMPLENQAEPARRPAVRRKRAVADKVEQLPAPDQIAPAVEAPIPVTEPVQTAVLPEVTAEPKQRSAIRRKRTAEAERPPAVEQTAAEPVKPKAIRRKRATEASPPPITEPVPAPVTTVESATAAAGDQAQTPPSVVKKPRAIPVRRIKKNAPVDGADEPVTKALDSAPDLAPPVVESPDQESSERNTPTQVKDSAVRRRPARQAAVSAAEPVHAAIQPVQLSIDDTLPSPAVTAEDAAGLAEPAAPAVLPAQADTESPRESEQAAQPMTNAAQPTAHESSPEAAEAASERDFGPPPQPRQRLPLPYRRPQPGQPSISPGREMPGRRLTPDNAPMSRIPRSHNVSRRVTAVPEPPPLPDDLAESNAENDQDLAGMPAVSATASLVDVPASAEQTDGEGAKDRRLPAETGDVQGGVLEIMPDGYGFLRKDNYLQGSKDIYVPPQYIRRFGLRPGDYITGPVRPQRDNDRYQALLYIKDVNGMAPEKMLKRPHFDRLTPIYPDERFILETVRTELSTRIIDLVAPIGKGQRGMIVSPPKAGKTILLQKIANAVSINNPDTKLIVLLIDERPEEVTDMQRSIKGEVVYSTFDKTPENHTKIVELVLERAMRLVELNQDVMILLDSMTRLARAYNLTINPTGRTLSGGLDPGALYGPKRFFGAARNIENGGSLTIIATSLIETGSRMDEVIFEEFKGTGNMEVYLDRKLSEKRIFPAIDINKSGTRREELLMNSRELDAVWTIRKAFSQLDTSAVTEAIINLLLKTKNNEHFISSVNVSFNDKNVFDAMRGTRPGQTQGGPGGQSGTSGPGYNNNASYNNTGYNSNYRRGGGSDDD
jgi:transcription termination factor Rho